MAFEEDDILGGLDLSVLDGIATAPEGDATKVDGTDVPVDEEPSIFQPGLAIKEVEAMTPHQNTPEMIDIS